MKLYQPALGSGFLKHSVVMGTRDSQSAQDQKHHLFLQVRLSVQLSADSFGTDICGDHLQLR